MVEAIPWVLAAVYILVAAWLVRAAVRSMIKQMEPPPERLELHCPYCKVRHIDEKDPETGIDWSQRPHRTHQCRACHRRWQPFEHETVGV